jgi:predicted DNA-binding protein (UPF0251 family)
MVSKAQTRSRGTEDSNPPRPTAQLLRTDVIADRQSRHCGFSLPKPQHLLLASCFQCNSLGESTSTQVGIRPKARQAIQFVKLDGLSVSEAAARSGMSESAIKVSVHRGLKALSLLATQRSRS